jgi:flagellin-specific chaperone FliS
VAKLLQEALTHFQLAQQALQNQDLATYQAEINKARELIQQAARVANQTPSPSPTPSPTASP